MDIKNVCVFISAVVIQFSWGDDDKRLLLEEKQLSSWIKWTWERSDEDADVELFFMMKCLMIYYLWPFCDVKEKSRIIMKNLSTKLSFVKWITVISLKGTKSVDY